MTIHVQCPTCGVRYEIDDKLQNRTGRCRGCELLFRFADNVVPPACASESANSTTNEPNRKDRQLPDAYPWPAVDHSGNKELMVFGSIAAAALLLTFMLEMWSNPHRVDPVSTLSTSPTFTPPPSLSVNVESNQHYSDPRDGRWDNPAGRELIRAMAKEAGATQEEMRKTVNDNLDRRGLSDWADQKR